MAGAGPNGQRVVCPEGRQCYRQVSVYPIGNVRSIHSTPPCSARAGGKLADITRPGPGEPPGPGVRRPGFVEPARTSALLSRIALPHPIPGGSRLAFDQRGSPPTMTINPETSTPAGPENDQEVPCQACGHQPSYHGSTGTRFCRATLDRALDRGCLCDPPDGAPATPMYGRGRYSGR